MVPAIVICPICGKRTFLRIQDGGYIYKYPIRVYCLNCHARLEGYYIMHESAGPLGLTMLNAKTEEISVHFGSERQIEADYVVEISGELPCKKVWEYDGKLIHDSPFLRATEQINMLGRIEQLKLFNSRMEAWARWRSIAVQLLIEGGEDYLPKALNNRMGEYQYNCSDYLKSLHCLQEVVREETHDVFYPINQDETIKNLLLSLSDLDRKQVCSLVDRIGGVVELKQSYRKVIEAFSSFMSVYQNLLPAETYLRYQSKNDSDLGISTCSFADIKNYYQDAYEALLSLWHIPVCLDNIKKRGNYLSFNSSYSDFYNSKPTIKNRYKNEPDDFARYLKLDNGKRAELLKEACEDIQEALALPVNRDLRNAITHNTYQYDGLTQEITIFDQKRTSQSKMTMSLMTVATDCIGLAKSTVIMAEILLCLLRREEAHNHSIVHPRYYGKPGPNDPCPCGSGKKYKACCWQTIKCIQRVSE